MTPASSGTVGREWVRDRTCVMLYVLRIASDSAAARLRTLR